MPGEAKRIVGPPYLHAAPIVSRMVFCTMGGLTVLAVLYGLMYDPMYLARYAGIVAAGVAIHVLYHLLLTGKFQLGRGSAMLTSALLVMSVPPTMPVLPLLFGLVVALVLTRLTVADKAIRFNAMLVGRLFLMLAYKEEIVAWSRRGLDLDAVSTATPLELFHAEDAACDLLSLVTGRIGGSWEGMYELVPGSPGEMFGPVILLIGAFLFWRGIGHWRVGVSFLAAFALSCLVMGEPVLFNLFSGAALFAAVFIAGDPKTTPISRGGRYTAGVIAGVANAFIRKHTYFSEGIVFSFLLLNLLTPTIDRVAFAVRGRVLTRRQRRFEQRLKATRVD